MVDIKRRFKQQGESNFILNQVFTFKEGDTITCIVNRQMKEIFFVKDVPNSHIVQTGMR
jgi:hypothetical protein